jgi:hypothetical protein
MNNWYKKIARMRGGTIPIMDDYASGRRPDAEDHKEHNDTLTRPKAEFGGNERPGYPKGISQNKDNEDDATWAKLHGTIPGEAVLMDDGGDSHEGLGDRFTARGENNEDDDTMPIGGEAERLDKGINGPHSMQRNRGSVFRNIKQRTRIKGLRL